MRVATVIASAQTKKSEHEKNDDDGTHEPDDSVHDGSSLLARLESAQDRRAPFAGTAPERI
jgi:hypothetical protein